MSTRVRLEVDNGVAVVTLDGPSTLNAFSAATARELSEAYRTCAEDDEVRGVVLTGAGRAFCSGADLSSEATSFVASDGFSASPVQPPAFELPKLVIAAVNGPAIGIGLTLALQCDLRIVARDARLAIPQVRRGMIGDAQSHFTLTRIAGVGVAADLLLTGRTFEGDEAVRLGVANQAVPSEQVLEVALAIAHDVATSASPASVALSKRLLWEDLPRDTVADRETVAHRILMAHPDAAEGPAAWREHRPARWSFQVSELPSSDADPSGNPGNRA